MKKILLIFIFIIISSSFFVAYAEDNTFFNEQLEASGAEELIDSLPDEVKEILEKNNIDEMSASSLLSLSFSDFVKIMLGLLKQQVKKPITIVCVVLGIVILISMLKGFSLSVNDSQSKIFSIVAVCCIAITVIIPVISSVKDTATGIKQCSNFMAGYIPVLSGIMMANGQVTSASSYNLMVFSSSEVIAQLADDVIVPFICIYMAFCIISAIDESLKLNSAAGLIKTSANWIIGLISTVFVGMLCVQGFLGNSVDSVTIRTSKFFISSFVPVVGSAMSEAITSVSGCLSLLKTTVGVFGILVLLIMILPLILELVIWNLALNLGAACSDIFGITQISTMLRSVSKALMLMLSVLICVALVFIVSTSVMIMIAAPS